MSNTEDGGLIVVGVEQSGANFKPVGIQADGIQTYDVQTLAHEICSYGSSGMQVLPQFAENGGSTYVLMNVAPFTDTPIICVRSLNPNNNGGIREGVVYYRDGSPQNHPATDAEFRRIIERSNWQFLRQRVQFVPRQASVAIDNAELYQKEIDGL